MTWRKLEFFNLIVPIYFVLCLCQITLSEQNFIMQIGNPLLEFAVDFNSPDEYYWSHGLISDGVYELLTKSCNSSQIMRGAIKGFLSSTCTSVYTELAKELTDFIDRYNVIGDVCLSSIQSQMDMLYQPLRSRFQYLTSLNSESDALSQQVKFIYLVKTHVMCAHYFFWFKTQPFVYGDHNWLYLYIYPLLTGKYKRGRCLCTRKHTKVFKQKRCADSSPCPTRWNQGMEFMQQAMIWAFFWKF